MYPNPLRRAHQMSSHYPPAAAAAADPPPPFVEASAWPKNFVLGKIQFRDFRLKIRFKTF